MCPIFPQDSHPPPRVLKSLRLLLTENLWPLPPPCPERLEWPVFLPVLLPCHHRDFHLPPSSALHNRDSQQTQIWNPPAKPPHSCQRPLLLLCPSPAASSPGINPPASQSQKGSCLWLEFPASITSPGFCGPRHSLAGTPATGSCLLFPCSHPLQDSAGRRLCLF